MKPYIAIGFASLMVGMCGCAPTAVREGRYETPEVDLPLRTIDLQQRVDGTPDGETVRVPLGRYELARPLNVNRRNNLHLAFAPGTQLRCGDTDQAVIAVKGSGGVTISGVRARHVTPRTEYNCHGPVISVQDSRAVRVENCELNGCGAIGVSARQSSLTITNCHIHHNTFNAFYFESCEDVSVVGNIIENNANTFQAYRCGEILWSDNLVRNNGGYWEKSRQPGLSPDGKTPSQPAGGK